MNALRWEPDSDLDGPEEPQEEHVEVDTSGKYLLNFDRFLCF